MEFKNSFINYVAHEYKSLYKNIELVVFSLAAFLMPIFIGHPQIIIGSIVNFMLFRTALTMDFKKNIPIILLPSIGALFAGVLFGSNTKFLLFFIPIIWTGNAIYILSTKFISHKFNKNYGANIIIPSILKFSAIFLPTLLLVDIFSFPVIFITSMGIIQLYTALIGGTIAFAATKIEIKFLYKQTIKTR